VADLYDQYRALHLLTQAERLRVAAEGLHSIVIRGLVMRLAEDFEALAVRAINDNRRLNPSNDDHERLP
jgi:hypothetical protein